MPKFMSRYLTQTAQRLWGTAAPDAMTGSALEPLRRLVHLHRSFYAIEAPVIYSGYETTNLYPTLD